MEGQFCKTGFEFSLFNKSQFLNFDLLKSPLLNFLKADPQTLLSIVYITPA
jgi:hypothetical protein